MVDDPVLARIVQTVTFSDEVLAVLLTSSRANPDAPLDRFSDYDIVLVVDDPAAWLADEGWISRVGEPLVMFRSGFTVDSVDVATRLVLYRDRTKVDYSIWPAGLLESIRSRGILPNVLDVGYRVLFDPRGLATDLPPPSFRAHIPAPPDETEFLAVVEEFWWESTNAAKNLARDELLPARYNLDVVMRDLLIRMLVWYVETEWDWSWKPGATGRGLKQQLPGDIWAAVEATFTGPAISDNWDALFRLAAVFRRVARDVADRLGYAYPEALDRGVMEYLHEVHGRDESRA